MKVHTSNKTTRPENKLKVFCAKPIGYTNGIVTYIIVYSVA